MDPRVIWAAGFFDGEGCICVVKSRQANGRLRYFLRVTAVQKVPEPLDILQEMFGGAIGKHSINKQMFYWATSAENAARMLERILPYLVVKKEQALEALRFQARRLRGGDRKNAEKVQEQLRDDESTYRGLQDLKHVFYEVG